MSIDLKKLSLSFLFATSCLITTAQSMMIDDKESARECLKINPGFFVDEFKEELKQVKQKYPPQTEDRSIHYTQDCAVARREDNSSYFRVKYYSSDYILGQVERWNVDVNFTGKTGSIPLSHKNIFLASYFNNANMNNIKFGDYYFCDSWTALTGVRKTTPLEELVYEEACKQARKAGQNSSVLFELLDSAVRRIGQKYSKFKMRLEERGVTPDEQNASAIYYLNKENLEINKLMVEVCQKALKASYNPILRDRHSHLPEWMQLFKKLEELGERNPEKHHIRLFGELIEKKAPLSEENIGKVMNVTESAYRKEDSMEERLKKFNLLVDENDRTSAKQATEWFTNAYGKEPTTQDLFVVEHMMKQEGLKLTPSLFEAAKVLMRGKEKIVSSPTKAQIEIAECWVANSKETVVKRHIERGEYLLKVGFPTVQFPGLKATCYLMDGRQPLVAEPTKGEIEATVYLMNLENFRERTAPQVEQIKITAKVMSLGFDKPNMKILKKARKALKNKKLENLTREDLDDNLETF